MKIGVIGSTGFLGQNLTGFLDKNEIQYVGGSRRTGLNATDVLSVTTWIEDNDITHVINLAAECGGIGMNRERPADLWRTTAAISHSVLEAARNCKVEKLIYVGTVCSYGNDTPVPFKEEYLMSYGAPEPTNRAYGVAKLSALYGAQAYAKQYGMNICNLIPVNMYGPHDHFDYVNSHVIPAIIRKMQDAQNEGLESIELWGTGNATREFLHARDCSEAIVMAMEKLETDEFINIGVGREISIQKLALIIASVMGYDGVIRWNCSMPDGQPRRCLDVSRAQEMMGWSASISLEEGIAETVDWFRHQ